MSKMTSRNLWWSWLNDLRLSLPLLFIITSLSSFSFGHRGPHHPRSSPRVGQEHHQHYVPHRKGNVAQPKLTRDTQLLHDTEHLKEDTGDWLFSDGKELSPEEMEFHYFKMHDFDNNSHLDGLEILQAISHVLPMSDTETDITKKHQGHAQPIVPLSPPEIESKKAELKKQKEDDFNYYIDLIDRVFEEDDLNKDGYLSYPEYVIGRRRDEIEAKKKGPYN